ncbi:MAG: hypothetical protein K6E49_08470 [Lachnospiraceae bacterium]|nr:hypothetical protein [Lachnospiraceae bacterium]
MKIGLDNDKTQKDTAQSDGLADLIKETESTKDTKFSDMTGKEKAGYIWDYYKFWIIGGIIAIIAVSVFIRDWRENSKPVYLYVEMLNTYFASDPSNTVYDDFVREENIDTDRERLTIGVETYLATDRYDTTMLAYQQRLVANYAAGELDVVIGPVDVMEGPANSGGYADLEKLLPQDLISELKDRDYEFYYFDPSKDELEDYEDEDMTPYFAGVYLDNCSYLNNMGADGAYPVPESEDQRVIFTISGSSTRVDHAIQFLRFLIEDR